MMEFIADNAGTIGLLFFFFFFLGVLGWIFRPGARKAYEHDARIPFEETRP